MQLPNVQPVCAITKISETTGIFNESGRMYYRNSSVETTCIRNALVAFLQWRKGCHWLHT